MDTVAVEGPPVLTPRGIRRSSLPLSEGERAALAGYLTVVIDECVRPLVRVAPENLQAAIGAQVGRYAPLRAALLQRIAGIVGEAVLLRAIAEVPGLDQAGRDRCRALGLNPEELRAHVGAIGKRNLGVLGLARRLHQQDGPEPLLLPWYATRLATPVAVEDMCLTAIFLACENELDLSGLSALVLFGEARLAAAAVTAQVELTEAGLADVRVGVQLRWAAAGLLEVPRLPTRLTGGDRSPTVPVSGEPLSQTILRDRR